MSRPKLENIENLWRNIEGPPPSIPFKFEENMNNFEAELEMGENPFEGEVHGPPGTEPYNDPFDSNGELGDYDAEVEIINLNKRVSREFSLSHYDVNIHQFGRLRAQQYSESEGGNSVPSEELIHSGELNHSDEFHSGELNHVDFAPREVNYVHDYEGSNDGTGSGHLICDCDDCINQTEAVECHCENCVQLGEGIPHSPPPGEITCDCDDCLNNSAESYTCDCENCRTEDKVLNNNHPDETCKCENCVDGHKADYSGEVCSCEEMVHSAGNGAEVWGSNRYRGLRGSPQGSSQQFDLPRIEEVDHLEECEHSSDIDLNIDGNKSKPVSEAFSNELYSKLENVRLGKGKSNSETAKLSKVAHKKDQLKSNKGTAKLTRAENVHVFNANSNENVHVFNTNSNENFHVFNGHLESENMCSNCEVGHSLDEGCAINVFNHEAHIVTENDRNACSCERCLPASPPPKGHTHIVQPLAVNIGR